MGMHGTRLGAVAIALALAGAAPAQDAVVTDGDKYAVLLENACVRVLDYHDLPGEETQPHSHPPFVLYALGPFERTISLPGGKVLRRSFQQGEVMWSDAQTHTGRNVGTTPTHVVLVELKDPGRATDAPCAAGPPP